VDPLPVKKEFNKKNALAKSAILQNIEQHLLGEFVGVVYAKNVWDSLKERFQGVSETAKLRLLDNLHNLTWKHNEMPADYFSRVRSTIQACVSAGKPVTVQEQVFYASKGIQDPRYQGLKDAMKFKDNLCLKDLEEVVLQKNEELSLSTVAHPKVFVAQRSVPSQASQKTYS